jgi:DNA transformation protein
MATSQATMDFLLDQLSGLAGVSAKKMFGEYCLYLSGKPVGLVCDDQLYLKPTASGGVLLGEPVEAPPYPGAKAHWLVTADLWEDRDWLCRLIVATDGELPQPRPKAPRRKSRNA